MKHPAVLIALAAVAGIAFGLVTGEWAGNLKVVGDAFIRLVQMAIVPLVMTSVIAACGSMTGSGTGRLALRTFAWMIGLSVVAAVVAVVLGLLFRPGAGMVATAAPDAALPAAAAPESWQDTVLGFFTTNVVESMAEAAMVPIILFSLLFGVALHRHVTATGNTLVLDVVGQFQQVLLTLIRLVMYVAPIGVFALLADLSGRIGFAVVGSALAYLGTTLLGVVLLTALFVAIVAGRTRLNPARLPRKLAEQTAVAVTTTSSAVTYPTVLRTTIEKIGVSPRVANFTLSVGLTMGSYGAVLNYTIVVLFLAQAGGVDLSAGQIVFGMVLAILLNMGTITVPGGFPVVALFLGTTLGLPLAAVGLLIAVDWFTGILRTFLNVNADTLVAMLVAHPDGEIDREVYDGVRAGEPAETGARSASDA
ncbi:MULTISPECIES: dicarboxylate/amino acid:cation symporter [unclassified Pseudonocardia]|uniref:dicarboxylate/amino acid:cation symporter n=1 Tax=unclassified Pseudonocardia TaxID=2619320 RepID=UPI0018EA0B0A|nr:MULTISPECIES: dicarboxylate/amino acid:cation symporter [unclassified Pseudonocardia]